MNFGANLSFEQYAEWARSRYPGYREEDAITDTEAVVYAETETPESDEACPVTVRSNRNGVVVTPRIQRSR